MNIPEGGSSWRSSFSDAERASVLDKLTKILSSLSSNSENNTDRIRQIALRFESQVYSAASNKNEYYQIISNKINSITDKGKGAMVGAPIPANGHHAYAGGGNSLSSGGGAGMQNVSAHSHGLYPGGQMQLKHAHSAPSTHLMRGSGSGGVSSSSGCASGSNSLNQQQGIAVNNSSGSAAPSASNNGMQSMYVAKPALISSAIMSPPASSLNMKMNGMYSQNGTPASSMLPSKNPFVPNPQQLLMNTLGKTSASSSASVPSGSGVGPNVTTKAGTFSFLPPKPAHNSLLEKEQQGAFSQKPAESCPSRYSQDYNHIGMVPSNPFIPHFSTSSKPVTPLISSQQHKAQSLMEGYSLNGRNQSQSQSSAPNYINSTNSDPKNDKFIDIVAPTPSFFPSKPILIHEQKSFSHQNQPMAQQFTNTPTMALSSNNGMQMNKIPQQTAPSDHSLPNLMLSNEEKNIVNRIVDSLKMYIPKVDSLLSICVKIGVPTEPLKKFCNLKNILLKQIELSKKDMYLLSPHMAENLSEHLKRFIDILLKKINEHPNASLLIAQYKAGLMGGNGAIPDSSSVCSSQLYSAYSSAIPSSANSVKPNGVSSALTLNGQDHNLARSNPGYEMNISAASLPAKKISSSPIIKESPFKFKATTNPFGGSLSSNVPAPAPNSSAKSYPINEGLMANDVQNITQSATITELIDQKATAETSKSSSASASSAATPKLTLPLARKEPARLLPSVSVPTAAYVKSTLKESESFPLKYLQVQADFLAEFKQPASKQSSPSKTPVSGLDKAVDLIKPMIAVFFGENDFASDHPDFSDAVFDGNQIEDSNFFDYDCLLEPHDITPFAVESSV